MLARSADFSKLERAALIATITSERNDMDPQKRYAVTMLGLIGDGEAVAPLVQLISQEGSRPVQRAAIRALGQLGDARAVPPLAVMLAAGAGFADPLDLASEAADALAEIGGREAEVALLVAASGDRPELALWALVALSRLPGAAATEAITRWEKAKPSDYARPLRPRPVTGGRRIHVDASSGDDSGDGSEASPFRSLTRALQDVRPAAGDRVLATAGERNIAFREQIKVRSEHSGAPEQPTVIGAWPDRAKPRMDGAAEQGSGGPRLSTGITIGGSWIRVEDFTFENFQLDGVGVYFGHHNVVARCIAFRCGRHGQFAYHAPDTTFLEPQASECEFQGISLRASPRALILGGSSRDNGIDGLLLLEDSDGAVIQGLALSGNLRGIALTTGTDSVRIAGVSSIGNRDSDLDLCRTCSVVLLDNEIGRYLRR